MFGRRILLTIQLLGNKSSPYLSKILKILASLMFLGILYLWFKEDMYVWLCEHEEASAACTIVGMMNEKQRYYDSADSYYERACKQDYALACYKRGLLAKERKQMDGAQKSLQRACNLGHKAACGLF